MSKKDLKDKSYKKPIINPLHRGRIILFITLFVLITVGVAVYDAYHASVLADVLY